MRLQGHLMSGSAVRSTQAVQGRAPISHTKGLGAIAAYTYTDTYTVQLTCAAGA